MKILLTFFVLLFSSSMFAETYVCSHELSGFDRPGEFETKSYSRDGDTFILENQDVFIISKDTENILMLVHVNKYINAYFTTIINKKTNEFTEALTSIEYAKEYEEIGLVYGKCNLL